MGRRTTLGAISPGSMNARRSSLGVSSRVAQGTTSAAGKPSNTGSSRRHSLRPPSTTGRQSTGGTRRSSLYSKTASGPKSDPRPVTDKGYQQACVRSIIAYLSSHGYDNAISPKQLSSPTTKDFLTIVTFLFKQIEPGFKVVGKLEEEIPGMFKRLRYPFSISKTALVAVGSPHTWPPLLAALAWLVELLNYSERALTSAEVAQTPEALTDRDASGDREFFEYVSKSYRYFLSGDDEMCGAVDEETESKFFQKDEQTQEDIERIKKANEALQAQLDEMTRQPSPKELLLQKREDILSDIEKLRSLLSSLQQHRGTLQKKIAEREADLQAKREEMALLEKESEGIRQKISVQPINKEDISRMNNDRAKLQMALDATTQHREQLDSQVAKSELALEEQMEALETAAWDYNKSADQLQLIPSTAKRAAGVEFEMAVNRNAANAHEMLSLDLKGVVRPALKRIYEQYVVKRRTANEALLMARERLGIQDEGLIERREENLAAEAQVRHMEEKHKAARESLEKAINSANSEVDKIQFEIANLQSSANNSVIESEERLVRGKEELEATKRGCHEELRALNDDLTTALNLLVNHKLHTQDVLEELQAKSQSTLAAINAQSVPI